MVFSSLKKTLLGAALSNFGDSFERFQHYQKVFSSLKEKLLGLWINSFLGHQVIHILKNFSSSVSHKIIKKKKNVTIALDLDGNFSLSFCKLLGFLICYNSCFFIIDQVFIIFELVPFLKFILFYAETLVHSSPFPRDSDFSFTMISDGESRTVYVRKRPFLEEFLEKVSEMFEVVIFTASTSSYSAKLLDVLDPHKKLFARRFYRDSCKWEDGHCLKDLTVLGIDMAKVFIIDNSPEVYIYYFFVL